MNPRQMQDFYPCEDWSFKGTQDFQILLLHFEI